MDLETLKNTPPWEWPEDTETTLLGILSDDRAKKSERLLAAELAGDLTVLNDALANALLAILRRGNETEELRCAAVISLGPALEHVDTMGFEDADEKPLSEEVFRGIQQSLRDLFQDAAVPQDVRRRILEASVRAPQDWHQDAVRAAHSNNDEPWQLTAVFCMRFIRGFDEEIIAALNRKAAAIHYQAVCAAGSWEIDAAWPHVAALAAADHTDKDLRLAAIDATAGIRPREAPGILGDLTDSEDEDIAAAAFDALTMAEAFSQCDEVRGP